MLYVIQADTTLIKIGYTRRNPVKRLQELQRYYPYELRLIGYTDGTITDERNLQRLIMEWHAWGEWFRASEEVIELVKLLLKWPSTAAATFWMVQFGPLSLEKSRELLKDMEHI